MRVGLGWGRGILQRCAAHISDVSRTGPANSRANIIPLRLLYIIMISNARSAHENDVLNYRVFANENCALNESNSEATNVCCKHIYAKSSHKKREYTIYRLDMPSQFRQVRTVVAISTSILMLTGPVYTLRWCRWHDSNCDRVHAIKWWHCAGCWCPHRTYTQTKTRRTHASKCARS